RLRFRRRLTASVRSLVAAQSNSPQAANTFCDSTEPHRKETTMTASQHMAETPPSPSPVDVVMGMALGYLISRSLHVSTELGIADLLKDGPKTVEELASSTGAHRESLYRLLRTLAAQGVFAEDEHGRFVTTPPAGLVQQDVMRDGVLLCGEVTGDGSWWHAVGALRHSIMTGEP